MVLNKAFENFLRGVIDEEELMMLKRSPAFSHCMDEFERKIKPSFSFTKPINSRVTFPGIQLTPDATVNLEASALTLKRYEPVLFLRSSCVKHIVVIRIDLERIFSTVCKEILELSKAQMRSVELKYAEETNPLVIKVSPGSREWRFGS